MLSKRSPRIMGSRPRTSMQRGKTQLVSAETVLALLSAFGVETRNQRAIEQSLRELEEARSRNVIEPVMCFGASGHTRST